MLIFQSFTDCLISFNWKLIASSQSESRGNLHFINRRFLLTRKEEPCNNDSIYRAIVRMSCVWLDMFRCMNNAELVTFNERVFRIRKRLGEGAFSFVYLVQERSTGKLYAMKRIVCHDAVEQRNVENEIFPSDQQQHMKRQFTAKVMNCHAIRWSKSTSFYHIIRGARFKMN
ncbi:Serine/threonine-protein kinase [Trichinella pseudospiralis]